MSISTTMDLTPIKTTTVDFTTISYAKIVQGDADELTSLRKACEQEGFWYLDLRGENREPIQAVKDVPVVLKVLDEFFQLEREEKMKYDVDEIGPWKLNGYVPIHLPVLTAITVSLLTLRCSYTPFGRNAGLAGDGEKHGVEGYTVRHTVYRSRQ